MTAFGLPDGLFRVLVAAAALGAGLPAAPAVAGCCRLVKTDVETAATLVQVCRPGVAGDCAELLFSGTLAIGEGQSVCTDSPTLIYREWDDALGAFGAAVEALCESADVEI